jgi:hydrogenase maturation factor
MVAVVAPADAEKTIAVLQAEGIDAYRLGELVESDEGVILY